MHSFDTMLEVADDSSFAGATEILKCRSIEPDDTTVTKSNAHHLRSPDAVKTKSAGMIEEGDLSVTALFEAATYGSMRTLMYSRETKYWRETLPDGSITSGPGFVSACGRPSAPDDDEITYSFKITPTGKWDFTPAA